MITLYDFINLMADSSQLIRLYDLNDDAEKIFEGEGNDIPDEYTDLTIQSIDNMYPGNDGYIGVNVDLSELEED